MLVRAVEGVLQQLDVGRLQRAERRAQFALFDAQAGALDAGAAPHVEHDGEAGARARLPAPHAQALVDGVQQAEVLVDAAAVAPAQREYVERGVQQEGELEVGAGLGRVRREEGDVEGVVLGRRKAGLGAGRKSYGGVGRADFFADYTYAGYGRLGGCVGCHEGDWVARTEQTSMMVSGSVQWFGLEGLYGTEKNPRCLIRPCIALRPFWGRGTSFLTLEITDQSTC